MCSSSRFLISLILLILKENNYLESESLKHQKFYSFHFKAQKTYFKYNATGTLTIGYV